MVDQSPSSTSLAQGSLLREVLSPLLDGPGMSLDEDLVRERRMPKPYLDPFSDNWHRRSTF